MDSKKGPGPISFNDSDFLALKNATKLYGRVKELVIFCEENSDEFKSNLQVVKEFRDAFDHMMRVFAYKVDLINDVPQSYVTHNILKMEGHIFRAAYDSLDYAGLIWRKKIIDELYGFTPEAIDAAIPEYYSKIKPEIDE